MILWKIQNDYNKLQNQILQTINFQNFGIEINIDLVLAERQVTLDSIDAQRIMQDN